MPDDQVSKPGAKLQPPSLPNQTPETSHARITWPVPHIMVHCGETEYAYGRRALANMGKTAFLEWMYRMHIWVPKNLYYGIEETYQTDHFKRSRYAKEADILGTFYDIHGASDTGAVKLSELGWDEMMQNVVKLDLVYMPEDSEGP